MVFLMVLSVGSKADSGDTMRDTLMLAWYWSI